MPFHRWGFLTDRVRTVWGSAGALPLATMLPAASFRSTETVQPSASTGNRSRRVVPETMGVTKTALVPPFSRSKWAGAVSMKLTSRYSPPKKVKSAVWG